MTERARGKARFKKSRLANGMVLVTESLPRFQSLSIGVWVNSGTRHEAKGEEGLSHFLEHMMFKGTEKRSALDIAQEVDRVGGEFNAFTSREYTCFHLLLLARDLRLAVDIMTDVLLNSAFSDDEIERERKVILQEISMVEDNPEELIHDLFLEQAFGGHALGKPILGNREAVARFDRNTVSAFCRKHYSPHNMVVSVAGDVSHEEARRLLDRYLKAAALGSQPRSMVYRKPNLRRPSVRPGLRVYRRDLEQAHVIVGFPCVSYDHPDRFAAFLLNVYLGGGMSSSLFQEIREKRGLAYSIYSSLEPFSDSGVFSMYVGTSGAEVATCLEVMGREVEKLRRAKLDAGALNILKDNLKGTILINSDSVENRMTTIAKNELFFGRYMPMPEVTRAIERVRPDDVLKLARALFRPRGLILSLMCRMKDPSGGRRLARRFLKHFG